MAELIPRVEVIAVVFLEKLLKIFDANIFSSSSECAFVFRLVFYTTRKINICYELNC